MEALSGPPTPAIGCAFGVERLLSLLDLSTFLDYDPLDVYFVPLGHNQRQVCFKLVNDLRRAGLNCEVGLSDSLKSELKTASKLDCKFAAIFGEEEAINNLILIKDMKNRTQESVSLSNLLGKVSS